MFVKNSWKLLRACFDLLLNFQTCLLNSLTLILIFLALDYGFKVHDIIFMDDFMMFRRTLECQNKLGNVVTMGNEWGDCNPWCSERHGLSGPMLGCSGWRAYPRPYGQRASCGAIEGPVPQSPTDVRFEFSSPFSTLNLLIIHGSFPENLESLIPSIPNRLYLKSDL